MQSLWQDFRYAFRMFGKTPVVTIMIVLSLAIGIGANSAIFCVVDALLLRPFDADSKIVVYFSNSQQPFGGMFLAARTASDPAGLAKPMVAEIHAVDPDVVVHEIRTMQERLYASLARQRFATTRLGSFAVFAVLLAAIGVYGVVSYLVSQNTHEIAIRIALGAQTGNVLGMVVQQGLTLASAGILAGLIGATPLTRVMTSLLFGVSALDAVTFLSVPVVLGLVAFGATVIPASRVIRVDPAVALRQD